jgi:hypothetical protein
MTTSVPPNQALQTDTTRCHAAMTSNLIEVDSGDSGDIAHVDERDAVVLQTLQGDAAASRELPLTQASGGCER